MTLPQQNRPKSSKPLRPVISALLMHKGEVLLLKRSNKVGSFQGYWSCISGYLETGENPLNTAFREISEETKLESSSLNLVNSSGPFYSEVPEVIFESHWFLVESNEKKITIDWEHDEYRWMKPEELEGLNLVPWIQNMITTLM